MVRKLLAARAPVGARAWLERAVGGATLILAHELDALWGHWAELRERVAVARGADGLVELVMEQVDLLPETRVRLALDQRERRALLNSWWTDLREGLKEAA